jgi:hypothetical protein
MKGSKLSGMLGTIDRAFTRKAERILSDPDIQPFNPWLYGYDPIRVALPEANAIDSEGRPHAHPEVARRRDRRAHRRACDARSRRTLR